MTPGAPERPGSNPSAAPGSEPTLPARVAPGSEPPLPARAASPSPPSRGFLLVALVLVGLLAVAVGVAIAWRERTGPSRELAALERAQARAGSLASKLGPRDPLPAIGAAVASLAAGRLVPQELAAIDVPGLAEVAVISLEKEDRQNPVLWQKHSSTSLRPWVSLVRGDPLRPADLAWWGKPNDEGTLTPGPWLFENLDLGNKTLTVGRGVEGGLARVEVVSVTFFRGPGPHRALLLLAAVEEPVPGLLGSAAISPEGR